jgi:ABC-2 type transport system ATP-binding protein
MQLSCHFYVIENRNARSLERWLSRSGGGFRTGLVKYTDRLRRMIECKYVTKRFGAVVALDNISILVPSGITALLGPNGAGKSTLLKILTGVLAPDRGEVRLLGFDIATEALQVKRAIGVVPEDLGLFDSLTIKEHLELCGPIYGLSLQETRDRIAPLLRLLGLESGRDTFLDRCSHGMRKKTALAMALLHSPRALLLDEPFEGVDPVSSRAIRDLLRALPARGVTVFLTSHILSTIDQLATDVFMIRSGNIVLTLPVAQLSRPLEDLYFDLVESPRREDLAWLGSLPF